MELAAWLRRMLVHLRQSPEGLGGRRGERWCDRPPLLQAGYGGSGPLRPAAGAGYWVVRN